MTTPGFGGPCAAGKRRSVGKPRGAEPSKNVYSCSIPTHASCAAPPASITRHAGQAPGPSSTALPGGINFHAFDSKVAQKVLVQMLRV